MIEILGTAAAAAAIFGKVADTLRVRRYRKIAERVYKEIWNEKDMQKASAVIDELVADDHILVDPSNPDPSAGAQGYKDDVRLFREALPEFKVTLDMTVIQPPLISCLITFKSTHEGTLAKWTATATFEISHGKVSKTWVNSDALSALVQYGVVKDVVGGQAGPFGRRPPTREAGNLAGTNLAMEKSQSSASLAAALVGRDTPHPEAGDILTGDEWLKYFYSVVDSAHTPSTGGGIPRAQASELRTDKVTGLDMVV